MKDLKDLKKYQNIIALTVLLAGGFYLYSAFGPNLALMDESNTDIGADLVRLSARLQAVNLDESLFDNPVYRSLSDFSIDVPPQPTGRPNPFEVLGQN